MRILNISFKNLNSLAGSWTIDLCAPEFEASGIFAITGPTGSGKSTILDAICLALYGCTPRLGKVSKGANDIMTRGTGDCYADVTFSTLKGKFRCRWSQRRARGKADGELQQARHELFDEEGVSLADKMHDVSAKVEALTGMDFERFTQSALLAQGRFATFLLAEGRDRAPLLEQMTGTEIYSQISAHVYRRCKAEQEKLAALDAELDSCSVLSEEEEQGLCESCLNIAEEVTSLDEQEKTLNGELGALRTLFSLQKEQHSLAEERALLDRQEEEFKEGRFRLENSRRAMNFSGSCSALLARQKEQQNDREEAQKLTDRLALLTTQAEEQEQRHQSAEQSLKAAKLEQAALLETLKSVRALDVQLASLSSDIHAREASSIKEQARQESASVLLSRHEAELEQGRTRVEEKSSWLEKHAGDALLAAQLGELRLACDQLEQQEQRLRERERIRVEKNEALAQKTQAVESLCLSHEKLVREQGEIKAQLADSIARISALLEGRSVSEWRQDKDMLAQRSHSLSALLDKARSLNSLLTQAAKLEDSIGELEKEREHAKAMLLSEQARLDETAKLRQELADSVSLLERIRSYEEARLYLKDGDPCPLCGALHHPYAQDFLPDTDEKKAQLEACTAAERDLQKALNLRQTNLAALERDAMHSRNSLLEKKEKIRALASSIAEDSATLALPLPENMAQEELISLLEQACSDSREHFDRVTSLCSQADAELEKEKRLHELHEQTRDNEQTARQQRIAAEQDLAILRTELKSLASEQEAEQARHENSFSQLSLQLTGLGCSVTDPQDISAALRSLAERSSLYQQEQERLSLLLSECTELEKLLLVDRQELKAVEERLHALGREKESLQASHENFRIQRLSLFGEKNADNEEAETSSRLHRAEQIRDNSRAGRDEALQKKADCCARITTLEKKIAEREGSLAADRAALLSRLVEAGFKDIASCLDACLTEEERTSLEGREQTLAEGRTSVTARMKECERRLSEFAGIPQRAEEDILAEIAAAREHKSSLQENLGAYREKLERNEDRKKAVARTLENRATQERTYRRWADLSELIGSADGKKFRNYAQELTFRVLIGHANRQLRSMTDRYLLVQDPKEALSLAVIDHYQADTIRTSKNLSGGESFLVSLSLALGLARMASRNVRVDSVFLDEGFGTLDDESLSTALDMLSSLRQQGKTIGVISHVQAIRERIGTRLLIEPEGNGRSRITGPGVRRETER